MNEPTPTNAMNQSIDKISYYIADHLKIGSPLREKRASVIRTILNVCIYTCTYLSILMVCFLACTLICAVPPAAWAIGHIAQSLVLFSVFWQPYPSPAREVINMLALDILCFLLVLLAAIIAVMMIAISLFAILIIAFIVLYILLGIIIFILGTIQHILVILGNYLESRNRRLEPNNDTELSDDAMLS